MPIYEFYCPNCTTMIEAIQKIDDAAPICYICNYVNTQKVLSTFGVEFKGDFPGNNIKQQQRAKDRYNGRKT